MFSGFSGGSHWAGLTRKINQKGSGERGQEMCCCSCCCGDKLEKCNWVRGGRSSKFGLFSVSFGSFLTTIGRDFSQGLGFNG